MFVWITGSLAWQVGINLLDVNIQKFQHCSLYNNKQEIMHNSKTQHQIGRNIEYYTCCVNTGCPENMLTVTLLV